MINGESVYLPKRGVSHEPAPDDADVLPSLPASGGVRHGG